MCGCPAVSPYSHPAYYSWRHQRGEVNPITEFIIQLMHGSKVNILIDNNATVRLSDFGISRILTTKGYTTDAAFCSCRWSSTELLGIENDEGDDQDGSTFSHLRTEASDVWAFGMTCLEVCDIFSIMYDDLLLVGLD